MATKIFVNLPVRNLNKLVEFFTKLGFTFNPQFTDETVSRWIRGFHRYAAATRFTWWRWTKINIRWAPSAFK
jgi:hypothetical protein